LLDFSLITLSNWQ